MSKFLIKGGKSLKGEVKLAGSKNSALALMPASLIADSPVTLDNVPVIRDVEVMGKIMNKLGAKIEGLGTNTLRIDPTSLSSYELDPELTEKIRASVILAAPLLVKFGKAVITPPGGDQIGERLLDTHFSMMRKFGVETKQEGRKFLLEWKNKKSPSVFLEEASVTATEMALILASSLEEEVKIDDAAAEPHVQDLADLLGKMGADIRGSGTNKLSINGSGNLSGTKHKVVSDHIEGGTFAIAAAITGGEVEIKGCDPEHYKMIIHYLKDMGVDVSCEGTTLKVSPSNLEAQRRMFQTRPWPGFPTDLMSPFIVLATQTKGTVLCHDWMYEWRVFFVDDLITMGANIFIADPHRVVVTGPTKLRAEKLFSKDIRAGMSIILAALAAEGESEIRNIEMVERGYENVKERFKGLGAQIKRIDTDDETA